MNSLLGMVLAGMLSLTIAAFALDPTPSRGRTTTAEPAYASPRPLPEPAVFGSGVISTGDDESHPEFTPDGRTLYFLKNTPTFSHWTVVVSEFEGGQWSTPEVAPFSGQYSDADVEFSSDGKSLFFVSNRPTSADGEPRADTDLWVIQRSESGWTEPRHLAELSSPGFEWFPSVTHDGTLYFGSERRPGNRGPDGTSDLWRSRLVDGRYTEPENLGEAINTPGNDIEAYVAPDETFMIFASNGHPDTRGSYDLYISYQQDGEWSEPQNLGSGINTEGWEFGARMSPDGKYLFFTSNRGLFDRPLQHRLDYGELLHIVRSPGNGLRDIYQVDASALPLPPR